jgi:signal peptidase I
VNRRTLRFLFELLETFLLALVVFLVVQFFVAQPYQVQQTSMEDTLMPDQYVLVDKLTPHFSDYHRGDVIVFNPPSGPGLDISGGPYIKRVIAVGGDTVDIHGGRVYVNGYQLSEPYVYEGQPTDMPDNGGKVWRIGPGQLFVLGDHRLISEDSRAFGPIEVSSVIGRAWLRFWPLGQLGLVPQDNESPASTGSPASSNAP